MKTLLTILLLLAAASAHTQTVHADLQAGLSSRLRYYGELGAVYRSYGGFETSATASVEYGHNYTIATTAGYAIGAQYERTSCAVVLYAGYGYTHHATEAKAEIGGHRYYPVVGVKWVESFGLFDVRYSANTFTVSFGYRFFNHKP